MISKEARAILNALTPKVGNPRTRTLGNASYDVPRSSGGMPMGDYSANMPLGRASALQPSAKSGWIRR